MDRIPEPELMEEPEQARAYAAADFSEPHAAFVARFRERFPDFSAGRVLDLGCGPGDVTLRFARALPGARIAGVDGSGPMLALARQAIDAAGLAGRVCTCRACLPAALAGPWDALISNSLLHHLADPSVLWTTVRRQARPGTAVFVMDLMRPESPEALEDLAVRHGGDAPPVLQRDFRASLAAAFTVAELRAQLADQGLAALAVEAVSDRHLVAWGRL